MKKPFTRFWRRNLAFFRLAIQTNLEYRFNYFIDAIAQPIVATVIEMTLWTSIFFISKKTEIIGFSENNYLSYALWAVFISRISVNWMYEFLMLEEVSSGSLNGILARPMNFFEYYLSQFLGYKLMTTFLSLLIPVIVSLVIGLPVLWSHLPLTLLLIGYYLIFLHMLSFFVCIFAFHLTHAQSLTMAKNLALWLLTGELFPLDLLPIAIKSVVLWLPFSAGVFVPTGYLIGRLAVADVQHGFLTVTMGICVLGLADFVFWRWSLKHYVGTGA